MGFVVLDSGALIAADRNDALFDAWWKGQLRRKMVLVVPAPVLAQVWRNGRKQAELARFLKQCEVVAMDRNAARSAGELCARPGTSDVVDAAVVLCAGTLECDILTGDLEDLRVLAFHQPGIGRIRTLSELR